ncbi:MAG TPA: hypothetical protein VK013_10190 [Myxococcaceae bacterium]|nr:hypothetical protein [Myxococcaceae bacterium]
MRTHSSILSLSLVIAAALFSAPGDARADGPRVRDAEVRVVTAPRPAPRAGGIWERRVTEVWVPASQERVWVDRTCHRRLGRSHRTRAYDCGSHEVRTVPGYLEQHEEWVWVPRRVARPGVTVHLPNPLGIDIRLSL